MPSPYRPPMPPRVREAVNQILQRINQAYDIPFTLDALVGNSEHRADLCPCCGAQLFRARDVAAVRAELWSELRELRTPSGRKTPVEDIATWFAVHHTTVTAATKRRRLREEAA